MKFPRLVLLSTVLSVSGAPVVALAQPGRGQIEIKLTDLKSQSTVAREKSQELRSGSGSLSATTKYYSELIVPTISQLSPKNINDVNKVRREFEDDLDYLNRSPEAFRNEFNKRILPELGKVIDNKDSSTGSRALAFTMAMQLFAEPIGNGPAVPSPLLLPYVAAAIRPDEQNDAVQFLALDMVDKMALAKPAKPENGITERHRAAFVQRVDALLKLDGPHYRLAPSHQKMMEQALLTMTTLATTGEANSQSVKNASQSVAKFAHLALTDLRSSEWLKEIACMCIGRVDIPADFFTPEQAIAIENEVAAFAIKSMKDWRIKVARTGGASGSYGMSSSSMEMGGYPGAMEGSGYPGGYPGASGQGGLPQSNVSRQPAEVKNARRMLNQRLERIHLALNGKPVAEANADTPAKRGVASFVPEAEKFRVDYAIEKLDLLLKELNSDQIADMSSMSNRVQLPLREFRLACVDISGDRNDEPEDEQYAPFGMFGNQNPGEGTEQVPPNGANAPPNGAPQQPGAPAAGGPAAGGPAAGGPQAPPPGGNAPRGPAPGAAPTGPAPPATR